MAALMAGAHAKYTGEVGVCMATSGPGALHLLAGLYDAKMDHMPVVAIVGQQAVSALGSDFQQEVNLAAVFEDVSDYTQRSEEHTSELQSLMRISYAVFCLKKKNTYT